MSTSTLALETASSTTELIDIEEAGSVKAKHKDGAAPPDARFVLR